MNIERFKLPVVVAAGLHGALFLGFPHPEVIVDASPAEAVRIPAPPSMDEPLIPLRVWDEDNEPGAVSGGARPLPVTPDALKPLTGKESFTVPVEPYRPVFNAAETLVDHRGLPTGRDFGPGRLGTPEIPDVSRLDRIPRAVVQTVPVYPDSLRRAGVEGAVTVAFIVDTDGRVSKAEVVQSSHREFEEAAVRAVLRWRFEPGTQGGRKVSFRMAVPILFNTER
jgi:periplasmic protein TonB